jgi:hypothetical protein
MIILLGQPFFQRAIVVILLVAVLAAAVGAGITLVRFLAVKVGAAIGQVLVELADQMAGLAP